MPQPLAEAMGTRREVHLFANEQDVEPYLYLGQLAGGFSYSGSPDYRRQWARFTLEPKLPRQLWLRFGGYPGWRVFLNHRRLLLESGDTETFAACLDEVRSGQDAHLFLTRYEEDSLKLLANETSAYLAYENSEGGSSNSWNPAILEDTEEVELFTCTCGINLEMPRCYAVEREAGLKVLEEYFRTGTLPDRIEWHED